MPLIDIKCDNCGREEKDIFVKHSQIENYTKICGKADGGCGSVMTKTISQSNFFLKGSGWERDSYGK